MKSRAAQIHELRLRIQLLPQNSRKRAPLERELSQLLTRQLKAEIRSERRAA